MKLYDVALFCDKETDVVFHLRTHGEDKSWPHTVIINASMGRDYAAPNITIHIATRRQLINFKNSVIQAYESFLRKEASNE